MIEGFYDAIIFDPEFVDIEEIAGRTIASSLGMLERNIEIKGPSLSCSIKVDHINPNLIGFFETLS